MPELPLDRLCCVAVYKNMMQLPIMKQILTLFKAINATPSDFYALTASYTDILYSLRDEGYESLGAYLKYHLQYDESPYGRHWAQNKPDGLFEKAARQDIDVFSELSVLPCSKLKGYMAANVSTEQKNIIAELPEWQTGQIISHDELIQSYQVNGCGVFALGKAFFWEDGRLLTVKNPDPISYYEMFGYEWQREEVVKNTRALIQGQNVNNILLHGDSGTGKSATVKSLINMPEFFNLRIIEISKDSLNQLAQAIRMISDKSQKFILFIDDISFEKEDKGYAVLKSVLEGGLELRPQNVVIYATSNRRHMVKEYFSDRQGDDIHIQETVQERTSLSERFGLRIPFMALNKQEFLAVVEKLAEYAGLEIDRQQLIIEANRWEIQHAGRTPRVAKQFVDYLQSMT